MMQISSKPQKKEPDIMSDSPFPYTAIGPSPIQLVVPIAVRNAVSAATNTFTASSMILCFFIVFSFFCDLSIPVYLY